MASVLREDLARDHQLGGEGDRRGGACGGEGVGRGRPRRRVHLAADLATRELFVARLSDGVLGPGLQPAAKYRSISPSARAAHR